MSAKRLKIGFVLDDSLDRPDGVQRYVVTLGEWLQQQGYEVFYLVSSTFRHDLGNLYDLAPNIGVMYGGNYLRTPLPARRAPIKALLEQEDFDLLHVQMPYSPFLAARVIQAASVRTAIVGTFHIVPRSKLGGWLNGLLAFWTRGTSEHFDEIMSVSRAAQQFAAKVYHLSSQVVPVPIILEPLRAAKPIHKNPGALEILFFGRLVPRKGCMQLLRALDQLTRMPDVPRWHATICGSGPQAPELHQYVREHKLESLVTFTGYVKESEKPAYYASADITVFPSDGGESLGTVLLEAMAMGCSAVIASNNPGYRTVLEACPGDVLFDAKDTSQFARKLRSLLSDSRERRHIADWQMHFVERFSLDRVGHDVLKVYASALRQRRSARSYDR